MTNGKIEIIVTDDDIDMKVNLVDSSRKFEIFLIHALVEALGLAIPERMTLGRIILHPRANRAMREISDGARIEMPNLGNGGDV